jgi:hypothetical protein
MSDLRLSSKERDFVLFMIEELSGYWKTVDPYDRETRELHVSSLKEAAKLRAKIMKKSGAR